MGLLAALARNAVNNARNSLDEFQHTAADRLTVAPVERGEHGDIATLSVPECLLLLAEGSVGRLAYVASSGVPEIVPVNYVWHDGTILIRSGPGPKLQAAERGEMVSFEIDRLDEEDGTGWSVVAAGRAARLRPEQAARLTLPLPWATGRRRYVISVAASRVSGRRLL